MAGLDDQRTVTRTEAAEYLREFADKLASGDRPGAEDPSPSTTTGGDDRDRTTDAGSTDATPREGDRDTATHGATEERGHERDESVTGTEPSDRSDGKVTFLVGNDSATVHPPEELTLGVEVGEDSAMMSSGAETVTFSLHWDAEAVPEDDELRIE
jgi:hypothetical protein